MTVGEAQHHQQPDTHRRHEQSNADRRSLNLSALPPDTFVPRSRLIVTYALCRFANFGSLGIMIGGLGTMAPGRRDEINALGVKSIISGTLTTCLMGAIVGVIS